MARVLIGTSGWHYDSWRGPFFPKGLPLKSQLQFYASQFSSAELNGVFYRTPTPEAVESWRFQTGKDFVFAWKASKFITHWKRLSESSTNSLELLEDRLSLLGNKVGPILFQLPPNFRADADRSVSFSRCCRATAGTASSFAIRVGIPRASSKCWRSGISRFACLIITTRRRHGGEPPTSYTSEVMVQVVVTEGTTPTAL